MAPRQGSEKGQEATWLPRWVRHRCHRTVHPLVETAWAIVFLFAWTPGCGREQPAARSTSRCAYDALVILQSDTYRPRRYRAVLATDGRCQRIAFYWLDPAAEIEPTDALAFSDFLFLSDKVLYKYHKDPNEVHSLPLGPGPLDQVLRLPTDKGLESTLGSILTLAVHNRTAVADREETMETSQFFQGARGHDRFHHTFKPPAGNAIGKALLSAWAKGDCQILNQLPFGRTYSNERNQKGCIVWRVSKATIPMEKVRVIFTPVTLHNVSAWSEISDSNTLGRWSAVPEVYRHYWSLKDQSVRLRRSPNVQEGQRLYAQITSWLVGPIPDEVSLAMKEVRFMASLYTGSDQAMASCAREYFDAYVRLAEEPVERIVIDLGRVGRELRVRWSEDQTRDFIRPLLKGIVEPKVFSDSEFVTKEVLERIRMQGRTWAWYEQLVRETVQEATGAHLESAGQATRAPDERNHIATTTDSEPNDFTTSADGQEHE